MVEMKKYKLYEVSDYVTSKVSTSQLSLQDYVTTDCLLQNKCGRECAENLPPKSAKVTAYKPGDILISNIRPYLKKIWYANSEGGNSADVLTIRAKENFEKLYIYYMLFQDSFFDYVSKGVKGSKMPRGDKNHIMNFEILVPENLQVQKKIASTLSDFDKRIENLRAQNRVLEQTAKAIYDYTFLQCADHQTTYNKTLNRNIPAGWEQKSLSQIESNIITGKTPSTECEDNFGGNISFITIDDIRQNTYIIKTARTLSEKGANTQSKKYLPEGSLCVSCIGTIGEVGFSVGTAQTNQQINSIVFSEDLNKYYLYFAIKEYFQYATPKQGATFGNMSKGEFEDIKLIYPDRATLEKFNMEVAPLFQKQLVNTKQIETLTTQRNTLLPLLMTGQIKV